jgi:lipid-A-disaccharide synthase
MEINSMMPVFMELADAWHATHPNDLFVVAAAPSRTLQDYARFLKNREYVKVVFGETYGAIRHAQAAVINSGTASLEAALIGTPQVVGYRMLGGTTTIARFIVKVPYISLGNLILGRLAFQELILENFKTPKLLAELTRLVEDAPYRQKMQADYAEIRQLLGGTGASAAVARAIIRSLKG